MTFSYVNKLVPKSTKKSPPNYIPDIIKTKLFSNKNLQIPYSQKTLMLQGGFSPPLTIKAPTSYCQTSAFVYNRFNNANDF